ncbi:DedA family protein [Agrobacterium albertimagni AOL15]|uniref:DedA family protein n=1 Tax=Agrobacterium albertimagni AOL15 TaxID=1156935 RepID=K2Q0Q4_9HYPH|nr:DedA family protein [Agrobacterium albertimagni]EKF58680.1 DedA family protein [Agrobacterium albertimagni AOL15]
MTLTETLLASLPSYGLLLLALVVGISCLGAPLPASIVMMLMGALAAAGDFTLAYVIAVALASAVAGDQIGYMLGRVAGQRLVPIVSREPSRRKAIERAQQEMDARGNVAVFLTRWLLSPLGPYLNLLAGASGFSWARFTLAGILGETVWVGLYTGLGAAFSESVTEIAEISGSISGFLAAGAVAAFLGWKLFQAMQSKD